MNVFVLTRDDDPEDFVVYSTTNIKDKLRKYFNTYIDKDADAKYFIEDMLSDGVYEDECRAYFLANVRVDED